MSDPKRDEFWFDEAGFKKWLTTGSSEPEPETDKEQDEEED